MEHNYERKGFDLEKRVFITLDVDWVCDEALLEVIELLDTLDITATVFATHDTPVLNNFRDADIELGIHPNFNELIKTGQGLPVAETVKEFKSFIPEATSVRSHSLSSGSLFSSAFIQEGFTHESNILIPFATQSNLMPFEAPKGLLQLPYNWGDYSYLQNKSGISMDDYLQIKGLKIMNFHPIHLFLNTDHSDLYNRAKVYTKDYQELKKFINTDREGIKDFLVAFIEKAKQVGYTFSKISDIPL